MNDLVPQRISKYERDKGLKYHVRRADLPPAPEGKRCKVCDELIPENLNGVSASTKGRGVRIYCVAHQRFETTRRAYKGRAISVLVLAFLSVIITPAIFAQGGNIGSSSSPTVNRQGIPVPGVSIAFCQPLTTTSATVTGNLAVLTMSSNPSTAGFLPGQTILIQGFTGADTYLNIGTLSNGQISGGVTILSVTSTSIVFQLNHSNASASSNGSVIQEGVSTTAPCGGQVQVYSDTGLTIPLSQPIQSDQLGNWNVFAPAGVYYVQFYGSGYQTNIRVIVVGASGGGGGNPAGAIGDLQIKAGSSAFGAAHINDNGAILAATEPFTDSVINNVIEASTQTGATWCAKLATAITSLAGASGRITAGFPPSGNGVCTSNPFPNNTPSYLQSITVEFTTAALLQTSVTLETYGPNMFIKASGPQVPKIQATSWGGSDKPIWDMGGGIQSNNNYLEGVQLDCNNQPHCTGLVVDGAENPSTIEKVNIDNVPDDGIRFQTSGAFTNNVAVRDTDVTSANIASGFYPVNVASGGDFTFDNFSWNADITCTDGMHLGGNGTILILNSGGESCINEINNITGFVTVINFNGSPDNVTGTTSIFKTNNNPYTLINVRNINNTIGPATYTLEDTNRVFQVTSAQCSFIRNLSVAGGNSSPNDSGDCIPNSDALPSIGSVSLHTTRLPTGYTPSATAYQIYDPSTLIPNIPQFLIENNGTVAFRGGGTNGYDIFFTANPTANRTIAWADVGMTPYGLNGIPVPGHCVVFGASVGLLGDSGQVGCGATVTLATNGTNNSSQTLLNNTTSTANANGLISTPTYSGTGIVKQEVTTASALAGTWNFSALTDNFEIPAAAGLVATSTFNLVIDTTGENLHAYLGADLLIPSVHAPGLWVTGDCAEIYVSGGLLGVQDNGSACGSGGSSIFTSYQFASAAAITGTGNYVQTTYPNIFLTNQTGMGTMGSPYIDAITMATQSANTVFTGPNSGGAAAPTFKAAPTFSAANLTNFPTLNQNTTGNAATATAFASTPTVCNTTQAAYGVGVGGNASCVTLLGALYGGTGANSSASTGVPYVTAGSWAWSNALPPAVTATTQSCGTSNLTIATTAFALTCTLANPLTTIGDLIYGGAAGSPTRLAGPTATNGVAQILTSTPSMGAAVAPVWGPAGVIPNPQTGATYTILATDRAGYVTFNRATAVAVTLPAAGGTGFASNFTLRVCDIGAGTATITPTTSTISYTVGGGYTSGASSMALTIGLCASIYSDNTNYFANIYGGGSGGGNTTSTSLTTNCLPKANGANSIIDSSLCDDGTVMITSEPFEAGGTGTYAVITTKTANQNIEIFSGNGTLGMPGTGYVGFGFNGTSDLTTINTSGLFSNYGGLLTSTATGALDLVPQMAWQTCTDATPCASSYTTLLTTGATTLFTIDAAVDCSSSVSTATAQISITYTDTSSTVQTIAPTAAACTTLGALSVQNIATSVVALTATNIKYKVVTANSPTYSARISIKQEGTN